jgi:hypothetical protein
MVMTADFVPMEVDPDNPQMAKGDGVHHAKGSLEEALYGDPSKLTEPIKDVKDKWKLLPAFLKVCIGSCCCRLALNDASMVIRSTSRLEVELKSHCMPNGVALDITTICPGRNGLSLHELLVSSTQPGLQSKASAQHCPS